MRIAAALVPPLAWRFLAIQTDAFSSQTPFLHRDSRSKDKNRNFNPHENWKQHLTEKSAASSSELESDNLASDAQYLVPTGESYSTLTLLEHMHLITPRAHHTGDDCKNNAIDFFVNVMGFGMDPKSVDSINKNSGVVFVNCGPSQLHLNDDHGYCQTMIDELGRDKINEAGAAKFEIGLRYNDLSLLKEQLSQANTEGSYEAVKGGDGREFLRVSDAYGRVFVARERAEHGSSSNNLDAPTISSICQQKIIRNCEGDISQHGSEIVKQYCTSGGITLCQGMDYIEFSVPVSKRDKNGNTMEKIASFYDFFFDAPTTVVNDGTSNIAIIGFGKIDENGRAEQSLLFREMFCDDPQHQLSSFSNDIVGTGHHIAIYVGANDADYEVAATNCVDGGLMWVNPQFTDRVLDVESAMESKQFRFKDIIDIETGKLLYVLEHEIRSVLHENFPGKQ